MRQEEKGALMRFRMVAVLLRTALALYAVASLTLCMKVSYVAAACAMLLEHGSGDSGPGVGKAAEAAVERFAAQLLQPGGGLEAMLAQVRAAIEESLEGWSIQRPCTEGDFGELWANVRHKIEDTSFEAGGDPSSFARGRSVRSSVLRHCFPFGHGDNDVFVQAVESALCDDEMPAVCISVLSALFGCYQAQITANFGGDQVLPLVRVVTQTQSEAAQLLSAQAPYLERMVTDATLLDFLKSLSGVGDGRHSPSQQPRSKRLLFVSDGSAATVDAVLAAASLARKHGGARVEVFAVALRVMDALPPVDSVRGLAFDVVVDLGPASVPLPLLVHKRVRWDTAGLRSGDEEDGLADRARALLIEMNG